MALTQAQRELVSGFGLRATLAAGAAGGVIGGALMAGWAMIAALIHGQSVVAQFALFGATFFGITALLGSPLAVGMGILLHLCVSALLGVVFAAIAGRESAPSLAAVSGVLFGIAVLLIMTYVLTPAVDPVLRERIPMMRGAWVIEHLLYGLGLSCVPWLRRRIEAPAERAQLAAFQRDPMRSAPPPARPPF